MELKGFYSSIATKVMIRRRNSTESTLDDGSHKVNRRKNKNSRKKQSLCPRRQTIRFPEDLGRPMDNLSKYDAEYFSRC